MRRKPHSRQRDALTRKEKTMQDIMQPMRCFSFTLHFYSQARRERNKKKQVRHAEEWNSN